MAPSFDEVYAQCHRDVFALCRGVLGNIEDAQDAAQDTFLAIARALDGFRGESNVKTWAHRIALRCSLKVRARGRRAPEPVPSEHLDATPDLRPRPSPNRDLARAMDALSFEHRAVISLFALEGLTHAEIAEVLGVPEGTVWSRLHTARKQLAARLAPKDGASVSGSPAARAGTRLS